MNTAAILSQLKAERERIDKAIAALEGLESRGTAKQPRRRRRLSAAARKRISEAAKKRWAALKAR